MASALTPSPHLAEVTTVGPIVIKPRVAPGSGAQSSRSVAIFNTGGTIGMHVNEAGSLEPCPGYLAERMLAMPEFGHGDDMPAVDLYELLPLIDSSDMAPADWLRIASAVREHYDEYDSFVVIMGTDTLAYAASALSFVLENLGKRWAR